MSGPVVAVVGLGAMGSRLARNLLADGYPLVVCARRPAATDDLVRSGARAAATPREAAEAADVALVCVADDTASLAVWTDGVDGLLAGLRPGAVGVEASTVSPQHARALAERCRAAGHELVEAPMIGSVPQVESRALVHLVGGAPVLPDVVSGVLHVSATAVHHTGGYGSAAAVKLLVNGLLATQVAAVAELLAAARGCGLDSDRVMELLGTLPVTSAAAARAGSAIVAGDRGVRFPVRLVRKDLRYLLELGAAGSPPSTLPVVRASLSRFDATAAEGRDDEDIIAVARTP